MSCFKSKYADELVANAKYIGTPGKGILAADQSTGTIGKRLSSINVENVGSNRRALRELLFCTPGALKYLSGVILLEKTLYQKTASGKPFVEVFKEGGVLTGIKVDAGTVVLAGTNGETTTQGLDNLGQRCAKYYQAGARFAKWRAVLKIGPNEPSELAIHENAYGLARYAAICQENGLVPILVPEILVDGPHDITKCAEVTERVLAACYEALKDHRVMLEGTLLSPKMVTPGSDAPKVAPEVVAEYTVRALLRTVPAEVPAIVFLSGGKWEEATLNLNAMNKLFKDKKPQSLSFLLGTLLEPNMVALTLNAMYKLFKDKKPQSLSFSLGTLLEPNMVTLILNAMNKLFKDKKPQSLLFSLDTLLNPNMVTLTRNAMNTLFNDKKPWSLSFSFGHTLQRSALKAWAGKERNVQEARAAFLTRCKASSKATLGTYKGDATLG